MSREGMTKMMVPDTPRGRLEAVIEAFGSLPDGEEYGVMTGEAEDHSPAVVIEMQGKYYGLLVDEARALATIMEGAMRRNPDDPAALSVPDFIMALRHTADALEGHCAFKVYDAWGTGKLQ